MLENVYEMFDLSLIKFKKTKKKTYEERMESIRAGYGHYFTEMITYVGDAIDKEAAAKEVAKAFTDSVFNHFAKRGKVRGLTGSDATLFMIFYVFPAILLTENENATLICDRLRDEWSVQFNNPALGYTTYADIHDSFKDKIFGLI